MALVNMSVHKVVHVKALVTEPREDIMGRRYCICKIFVTDEDENITEIDLFGRGHDIEFEGNPSAEIYPFVEIERPTVED